MGGIFRAIEASAPIGSRTAGTVPRVMRHRSGNPRPLYCFAIAASRLSSREQPVTQKVFGIDEMGRRNSSAIPFTSDLFLYPQRSNPPPPRAALQLKSDVADGGTAYAGSLPEPHQ